MRDDALSNSNSFSVWDFFRNGCHSRWAEEVNKNIFCTERWLSFQRGYFLTRLNVIFRWYANTYVEEKPLFPGWYSSLVNVCNFIEKQRCIFVVYSTEQILILKWTGKIMRGSSSFSPFLETFHIPNGSTELLKESSYLFVCQRYKKLQNQNGWVLCMQLI